MTEIFHNPTTHKEEILLHMIENGSVSIMDFPYMSGFRTRISELVNEDKLTIDTEAKTGRNKFGNRYTYIVHRLNDRSKAIEVYNNLKSN